jgi:hypothetical protein
VKKTVSKHKRRTTTTRTREPHKTHENREFDFAAVEKMVTIEPSIEECDFDPAAIEKLIADAPICDPGCTPDAFRRILRDAGFAADAPLIVSVEQPATGDYIEFIEFEGGWKRHDPAESGPRPT